MSNIVIAFSKPEVAAGIKNIDTEWVFRAGSLYHRRTGSKRKQSGVWNLGLRMPVYGYDVYGNSRLSATGVSDASDRFPASIQEREVSNLVCLSMPMKVHELLQTIEMMEGDIQRRRRRMRQQPKHRSQEDQQIIRKAKELLMARNSFTEEEAHKYIQKRSMDNGTGLVEVAQMILSLLQEG